MIKCFSDVTLYVAKYRGKYIRFGDNGYMFMGSNPRKSIAHSADKNLIKVTEYLYSIGQDILADDLLNYFLEDSLNTEEWLVNAVNAIILKPDSGYFTSDWIPTNLPRRSERTHYTEDFYQYCRDLKVSSVVTIEEVTNVVT